jgi:photosystem II stability/assembly factor-like uncharacterized protein
MSDDVVRRRRLARAVIAGAVLAIVGGCGSTAPPTNGPPPSTAIPKPSDAPVLGLDWVGAASVEAPDNFGGDASLPPYKGNHPILRIPGQAIMAGVTGLAAGGFVVVGYAPPDWLPVAWTSSDGDNWKIHPMGTTGFTFPVSVVARADNAIVAVGRSGPMSVAWTSFDGVAWPRTKFHVSEAAMSPSG